PPRLHPVAGLGAAALALERAAWRPSRLAGAAYAALVVAAAGAAGRAAPGAVVVWTVLGARSLGREALAVAAAVEAGDLACPRTRARMPACSRLHSPARSA